MESDCVTELTERWYDGDGTDCVTAGTVTIMGRWGRLRLCEGGDGSGRVKLVKATIVHCWG
jgi:hypothetical protein